jgi:hypothetical protein
MFTVRVDFPPCAQRGFGSDPKGKKRHEGEAPEQIRVSKQLAKPMLAARRILRIQQSEEIQSFAGSKTHKQKAGHKVK